MSVQPEVPNLRAQDKASGATTPLSRPAVRVIALGAILSAFLGMVLAVHFHADDGYIFLRYVRNVLDGFGPVYNPGDPVEGYTSFLWVMVLSGLGAALRGVDLVTISEVTGTVFSLATVVMTFVAARTLRPERPGWALLATLLVGFNAGLIAWSTGGLETAMFSFLVLSAVFALLKALEAQRSPWLAALLFGVATLTRPDGVPIFLAASLWFAFSEWRAGRSLFSKRTLTWAGLFLAVVVPWFLWRYDYYGFLLPNTAYAKVGSGLAQYRRGVDYVLRWGLLYGYALWALPMIWMVLTSRDRIRDGLATVFGVHLLFVIYVGGDGLAFFRFMVYCFPLLALLVSDGLIHIGGTVARRLPARLAVVASAAFLVPVLWTTSRQAMSPTLFPSANHWVEPQSEIGFPGNGTDHSYKWFDNYFVDRQAAAARWLKAEAAPDATIASTPAGAIAYFSGSRVIDMLGLNDVHIAHAEVEAMGSGRAGHEKGDGAYVLSLKPDYILLGNVAVLPFPLDSVGMAGKLIRRSEHEIWSSPEFHRDYERVVAELSDSGVLRYFTYYQRREIGRPDQRVP